MSKIRRASHAGSWYSSSAKELRQQLEEWLAAAELTHGPARAVIVPHAGYSYCGDTAAFAYRQISPSTVTRVFILGPSHHVRLSACALSSQSKYATPFYDLNIDNDIYKELESNNGFERMNLQADEAEHSLEMTLPFVAKVMEGRNFTIVPIMVGSLSPDKEKYYGAILAKYLAEPNNLFVISSDFCHWGQRFRYDQYDKSKGQIFESIRDLDRTGMDAVEELSPQKFTEYLQRTGNTICGRHPIGVLLNATRSLPTAGMHLKFLRYSQSNECRNPSDSSVSYAAASLIFE